MNSDRTLINFRVPNELIEAFDQSCDFKNMTRTQTLIELMRRYVDKTIPEIQSWNTLYQMTGRTPLNRV
jgi:hypothetical protein